MLRNGRACCPSDAPAAVARESWVARQTCVHRRMGYPPRWGSGDTGTRSPRQPPVAQRTKRSRRGRVHRKPRGDAACLCRMNADLPVAKFDLCRELYELSGWNWTNRYFRIFEGKLVAVEAVLGLPKTGVHLPAYDAGYLLEKLPHKVDAARLVRDGIPLRGYLGLAQFFRFEILFDF